MSLIDPYYKGPDVVIHDEDLGKGGSKVGKKYVRQGQGEKFYTEEEQDKAMRTKTWGKDPPLKDRIYTTGLLRWDSRSIQHPIPL